MESPGCARAYFAVRLVVHPPSGPYNSGDRTEAGKGGMALRLRQRTADEQETIRRLAHARTEPARVVERARIVWLAGQGRRGPHIATELRVNQETVRRWLKRFNAEGLAGLKDGPRAGRPPTYSEDEVGEVVATSLTDPLSLGLPFASWTLDRLVAYLNEEKGIPIKRSRVGELLLAEGLRWRQQETWFGERVDPDFAQKRGPSSGSTRRRRRARSSSASTRWVRSRPRATPAKSPSARRRRAPMVRTARPGGPSRKSTTAAAARGTSSAPSDRPPARR